MEDLDRRLDPMFREIMYTLLSSNVARMGTLNIRYTRDGKRDSLEHVDALCESYEKVLRDIPKQFLKTEKEIRLKYMAPMDEKRQGYLLKRMNTEVEMLVENMIRELRTFYKNLHKAEEFDQRMQANLVASKERIEKGTRELAVILNKESSTSDRIQPGELAKIYGLDETTLIDLQAIRPLQTLHQVFDPLSGDEQARIALDGVRKSIVLCSKFGTHIEVDARQLRTVETRRLKKNSMVAGTLVLNELISNIGALAEQLRLPAERRNEEIISKIWNRLKDSIEGYDGAEQVLECVTPFFQMLALPEKQG